MNNIVLTEKEDLLKLRGKFRVPARPRADTIGLLARMIAAGMLAGAIMYAAILTRVLVLLPHS